MANCPLCNGSADAPSLARVTLVPGADYDLVPCSGCGGVRFDPLPTLEDLGRFYSASYYDFPRWKQEAGGRWFARQLRRIASEGRFLDVGCATGFFLNGIAGACDWTVHGVEFSPEAVEYAQGELGLDVVAGDLQDAGFPDDHFDYVHVNNVLEHVLDPLGMLAECRRILKPGGRLYLAVPNGANDMAGLVEFHRRKGRPARSPSGHIFFFPAQCLLAMFARLGFEVLSSRTGSVKRGLRNAGILPRKKGWERDYEPREAAPAPAVQKVVIPDEKRKSELYYRYRNWSADAGNLPGLHGFGLDFLFELRLDG